MINIIKNTFLSKYYWQQCIEVAKLSLEILYGKTILGKFWLTAKPLTQIIFIGFVFSKVMLVATPNYPAFTMYNVLLMLFITTSINYSYTAITENISILKRFNINKSLFTSSNVLQNLYIYLTSLTIIGGIIFIFGGLEFHLNMIFAPIYLLYIVIVLIITCCTFSIIYPYLTDISFIIDTVLMIAMWVTPIFYPIEQMPIWMQKMSYFNPFFILIVPFTRLLHLGLLPTLNMHIAMFGLLFLVFMIFYIVRKKLSRNIIYYC